ncbi:Methyl-accepting chemotaxis protein McpB [Sporomusa ovata DSM 2662]|uniref:Methyl-accepting chemotaxis protein n=1 Tax=Sporomusa ovata TaxID=2378 RepID=A0A0U1KTD4_9FIRM|nr:HAMP domain-containing methyl-accepting chemotaxis protein [Sporomusa ovata]EQB26601.1 methyl-accepting chemotaxis protein McpB [Sporomusa ovata DSM 2662]CQR70690.1 Methyl-accepting chemotaxis protein [Sporomusa ovata]
MNLSAKMIVAFLVVVMVSAIGSAYVFYKIGQSSTSIEFVDQYALPRLDGASQVTANAIGKVGNIRGYLFFNKQNYIDEYHKQARENEQLEAALISDAKSEKALEFLQEIKTLDDKYNEVFAKRVLTLKQAGKNQEAIQVAAEELTPIGLALIAKSREYQNFGVQTTKSELRVSMQASNAARTAAVSSSIIAAILGILVGLFATRIITRSLKVMLSFSQELANGDFRDKPRTFVSKDEFGQLADALVNMRSSLRTMMKHVNESAEQVAASSEELTASADQSAQAANQVASSITDVAKGTEEQLIAASNASAVVEQMSAGIQQIAANTNEVFEQSAQAANKAQEGNKSVERAVTQMAQVEQTVTTSAEIITQLGGRSKEIGQIVDAISTIAGQTNLLALNAAIEAARAGEQGRGFAVVAEEVRKLAEQSQEAAKQIATLINEIQCDTDKAVVAMNDGTREVKLGAEVVNASGQAFREIATLVTQVSAQVKEISTAIEQMAIGSQHIVGSVKRIDELSKKASEETQTVSAATEEQSASMQEIDSASQELAKLAVELRETINKFQI